MHFVWASHPSPFQLHNEIDGLNIRGFISLGGPLLWANEVASGPLKQSFDAYFGGIESSQRVTPAELRKKVQSSPPYLVVYGDYESRAMIVNGIDLYLHKVDSGEIPGPRPEVQIPKGHNHLSPIIGLGLCEES